MLMSTIIVSIAYLERVELVNLTNVEIVRLKVELVWHGRCQVMEL